MSAGRKGAGDHSHRWRIACWVILALAILWTGLHLNWQAEGETAILSSSPAAKRLGERMAMAFPEGQVQANTAGVDELLALQGVGPSLAQVILEEREANGSFRFPEDLLSVKGIGEKKLEGFWEQLRLDEPEGGE